LSLRQQTAKPFTNAPGQPFTTSGDYTVPANTSTNDVVNTILKTAFGPSGGGQGAGGEPRTSGGQFPFTSNGPPVGPPGTAQLARIEAARAAGQGYVSGDVYNQPAGTAGMDFNTNTGEWVPKERVGTINGVPANMAIRNPLYSNALAEHGVAPAMNVAEMGRHGITSMLPQTTTGQPITPELTPAPGGGVQISARPDAGQYTVPAGPPMVQPNQYPASIGPPVVAVNPNVRPPTVDVDKLLQSTVGGPSMEELERRRRAQQVAVLTPFRTNQY
jgi:hypothetical protein